MAATESSGDLFRNTLTELDRLVEVRAKLFDNRSRVNLDKVIFHKLKVLTEHDIDTSELKAIEDLEFLATLKQKTKMQSEIFFEPDVNDEKFDKVIDSKIDFIKSDYFNRFASRGGVDPMAALERLTEIQNKIYPTDISDILEVKMRQIMYPPLPKPSNHSTIDSAVNVQKAPVVASHNEEIKKRTKCKEPKKTAKLVSSFLAWLQDQDEFNTEEDGDDSTEDEGVLTPTSTAVSGHPDY